MGGQFAKVHRSVRSAITSLLPKPVLIKLRQLRNEWPLLCFEFIPSRRLSFARRRTLVQRIRTAHEGIECPHTHREIIRMIKTILSVPASDKGCIVEAGCFKGGSTAKLSIAARLANRTLMVFDSFEG